MTASERSIAIATLCYQNESMVNLLIRDIPESVHARLIARAEAAGQSLQQFLLSELTKISDVRSLDEMLELSAREATGNITFADAVAALRADREER